MTGKESLQPTTVVVHGDYLDPSTRAAVAAVAEAGGQVEFRHLPRKSGLAAAVAAEAARELGAFDAMHERLLAHDGPLGTDDLRPTSARSRAICASEPNADSNASGSSPASRA